jgi:Protein of unknown function (DUF2971)
MTIDPPFIAQSFPISATIDPRGFARTLSASGKHPPILYHYTNEAGLKGIVTPASWDMDNPALEPMLARAAQLRASDVRYMNDWKELLFGAESLVERLRTAAADPSAPPNLASTFDRLANAFCNTDVRSWTLRCFAACFCESGDLITQWQAYAEGTGGYAIGFSWDALVEHSFAFHPESTAMGTTAFPAGLRRMAYDTPAAEAMADGVVGGLRNAYENPQAGFVRGMINGGEAGLYFLATLLMADLATVKHGAWKHEQEWRLIAVSEPQYPVNSRPGRNGDVPYLDLAVNMNAAGVPATIAELVVGPGPDQPGRIAAARELLDERGHDPHVVVGSEAPLKW